MSADRPKLKSAHRSFLKKTFPGDGLVLAPEAMHVFGADNSRRFAMPLAVVRPSNLEQVRELLAFCHKEKIPLYPRGRGTNTVGGCTPLQPGVVVSAAFLNTVLEISNEDFLAVCEPGVITGALQTQAAAKGLFYPPDPASAAFSTIGGNVSTCAGGMRAVKYGVTRDYVLGLEAVLPGGEVIHTGGRAHKNVAGLDLTRLLVGAAGTLAFITKITLKLLPLPEASASLAAAYATLEDALAAAKNVFASGLLPTSMELMAEEVLSAIGPHGVMPWPGETKAVLLLRVDGSAEAVKADAARLSKVLAGPGTLHLETAATPVSEKALWDLRSLINPASYGLAPDKLSDDATFPRGALGQAILGIREIGARYGLLILIFGHLGDGNLHINIMYDAKNADEAKRAAKAREEIITLTLSLGGSLSGEHGVGLSKLPFLDRQFAPAERALMRRVKAAFDPHGVMNPGKGY
jgi:glycolate oxidase